MTKINIRMTKENSNPKSALSEIERGANPKWEFALLRISHRNSYDDAWFRESFLTDFSSSHHWEVV